MMASLNSFGAFFRRMMLQKMNKATIDMALYLNGATTPKEIAAVIDEMLWTESYWETVPERVKLAVDSFARSSLAVWDLNKYCESCGQALPHE